jgi:hypothetical protein
MALDPFKYGGDNETRTRDLRRDRTRCSVFPSLFRYFQTFWGFWGSYLKIKVLPKVLPFHFQKR